MQKYLMIFGISFITTIILTPISMKIAHRFHILDRPDNALKIHKKPIPYLGGLAIFAGITIAVLFACSLFDLEMKLLFPVGIGMFSIMLLGLLDDIFNIRQTYKFVI